MAFDTLFPEITQPTVSSTTPITGGQTAPSNLWGQYQQYSGMSDMDWKSQEAKRLGGQWMEEGQTPGWDRQSGLWFQGDEGNWFQKEDVNIGPRQTQSDWLFGKGYVTPEYYSNKRLAMDPTQFINQWMAPGASAIQDPNFGTMYQRPTWEQADKQGLYTNPVFRKEGESYGPYYNPMFSADVAKQVGVGYGPSNEGGGGLRGVLNKNVDWAVPLALAAMGGYAAMGATGALGAAGSGTAGAGTAGTAAGGATTAGAAPLFGAAPVAGAPTIGAGGALGATSLGTGTLATEGLGAGSLWGGASGAMTAGAGTAASSLFGEGIGDLSNMAVNEGVTTPMTETVNDGWLFDQMGGTTGAETPSGMDLAGDLATSQPGEAGYMGNMAPQSGGLTMPSMTDLAKFGYSIYNTQQQNQRAMQLYQQAQQGMQASDPFAPGRASALAQYQQMVRDPMSYMSSPLAQMQIDQMNRAQRAKQAQLGDTWSINQATGNIQGSGTGAVDFATQMQQNLAKQYETALQNRAQQAGMNLFPNAQFLQQMGQAAGMQKQAGSQQSGLFGMGVDLAKQSGLFDWAGSQLGGLFGA